MASSLSISSNIGYIGQSLSSSLRTMVDNPTASTLLSLFFISITYVAFSPDLRHNFKVGKGLPVGIYLIFCFVSYFFFPSCCGLSYTLLLLPFHFWSFPLEELAGFLFQVGELVSISAKVRHQLPNLLPYTLDLLPYTPKILKKIDVVLVNIEVMGEAMPKMMEEKEYILPVMDQILDKLEIIAPTIPSMMPIIHKVAPKIDKLLPKIEIMAPYIDDLLPLWDDLEPHLDTMLLEMDNLAPLLPKVAKDMDKMVPVLNLMPIIHETGALNIDIIKNSVPFMTKLLPKSQDLIARSLLTHASRALEKVAVTGKNFIEGNKYSSVMNKGC